MGTSLKEYAKCMNDFSIIQNGLSVVLVWLLTSEIRWIVRKRKQNLQNTKAESNELRVTDKSWTVGDKEGTPMYW